MPEVEAPPKREDLIGQTIAGRYKLCALIGQGGMGAVYEAEHTELAGKRVAVKLVDADLKTDDGVMSRFAREARAMSTIQSAHIVSVFDAGTADGHPYLVMELLKGEDLGKWLGRSRRIPLKSALHITAQVLKGLSKAHQAGIIHRDLKPDNVFLLNRDGDPHFAKIVDFGVSKIERPRDKTTPLALTGRGTVVGTPFYMSSEQAQAMPDVDGRADLYSVGAILFECLSGRPPHTGETYEQVILSICMRDAPDLRAIEPTVPANVAIFVAKALSRERGDRFPTAERMLAALHEIAPEERMRVPLELALETMVSAGAGAATQVSGSIRFDDPIPASQPSPPSSRATPAAVAAPPMAVPIQVARARISDPAPVSERASTQPEKKRSPMLIIVTAIVATCMGVGAMIGLMKALDRTPEQPATKLVTAPPPSSAPAAVSVAPSVTVSAPVSAVPEEPPPPPATPSTASQPKPKPRPKPASSKLDIARDLP